MSSLLLLDYSLYVFHFVCLCCHYMNYKKRQKSLNEITKYSCQHSLEIKINNTKVTPLLLYLVYSVVGFRGKWQQQAWNEGKCKVLGRDGKWGYLLRDHERWNICGLQVRCVSFISTSNTYRNNQVHIPLKHEQHWFKLWRS